jgi:DNA integrity scanning protein DisA with diadenylate cyclase activity
MDITMTETRFKLKEGTKTVFTQTESKTKELTEEQYNRVLDSAPFFRRLGGSETLIKGYTPRGYRVVRHISRSPDREIKVIREYDFS